MPKGFMDGYKKYDPDADGFGGPRQWRNSFHARMGFEEAEERVNEKQKRKGFGPLGTLGLFEGATWAEVKRAYRKMMTIWHPDKFMQASAVEQAEALEMSKDITAAYTVLERRYGK